ncbi:D-beta-D-heptose 7-phosphate kinase [bacterium HR19]|nr:D-beta-D-heptose 7-phosphate kinase [bacterium HR19]
MIEELELKSNLTEIKKKFEKIFENFSKLKIAVLGDVMLDSYLIGDTKRISPEAPVPVIEISKNYNKLGGAANTALNIKRLGNCKVKLFSIAGKDNEGKILKQLLENEKIEHFILEDESRPTTLKTRIIARGQQILRIDNEKTSPISDKLSDQILKEIKKEKFDIIVFSDYAKGFFTEKTSLAKEEGKTICDPKPQNVELFKGVYILLPNISEAYEIKKIIEGGKEETLFQLAMKIKEKLKIEKLVITQGEEGMTVFSGRNFHVKAFAKDVFDVTGAGDTVTAMFSLCEGIGLEDEKSAILSSIAASCKVSHLGTYAPEKHEIYKFLNNLLNSENF